MAVIFAFITGERHTEESRAHGDAAERGWVDPRWSMTEFYDSRNDVTPAFMEWEQHEHLPAALVRDDFADAVREVISDTLGAYTDNGDGTFYANDAKVWDYSTDDDYTYALHFVISTADGERAWHPSEMGITLP